MWIANSAATVHVSSNQDYFTSYCKYETCWDIKAFGNNTVKGVREGDIIADIKYEGKSEEFSSLKSCTYWVQMEKYPEGSRPEGLQNCITEGQIQIIKGAEVYTEASLGRELYKVKMKIIPSWETRADGARREQTWSENKTTRNISNKVLITRVTRDAPEIKIWKWTTKSKWKKLALVHASCEEEFM